MLNVGNRNKDTYDNDKNQDFEFQAALSLFPLWLDAKQRALEVVQWCRTNGAKILYPEHLDYPFEPGRLEFPPPFVSYFGHPVWKSANCISVVGSREPTRRSLSWLELNFPDFLSRSHAVVVSGGARGIDQKVHSLALRSQSPTIVFLPSGLACPYPAEWRDWREHVVACGGAVISIHAPYQEIRRHHFEGRNRLITALGKILFVVEARRRSGSIMTARLAREIDRTICVLPASPADPCSAGTVDLLFDGAYPIRDSKDLATLFSLNAFKNS